MSDNQFDDQFNNELLNSFKNEYGEQIIEEIQYNIHDDKIKNRSIDELVGDLAIYAKLGKSSEKVVREIVWKAGADRETFMRFFKQDEEIKFLYQLNKDNIDPIVYNEMNEYYYSFYTMEQLDVRFNGIKLENIIRANNTRLFFWAVNETDICKKIRDQKKITNYYELAISMNNDNLDIIEFIHKNMMPVNEKIMRKMAYHNRMVLLQWARDNDCPWDTDTCSFAALGGNLELLQWVRENGCPWDKRTCEYAARNGYLNVLMWAHENGCPWDEVTCAAAAEGGHLGILQWAREHGCPWNETTLYKAMFINDPHIFYWANLHGCTFQSTYVIVVLIQLLIKLCYLTSIFAMKYIYEKIVYGCKKIGNCVIYILSWLNPYSYHIE